MSQHTIFNCPLDGPVPDSAQTIVFGMGCFWGVERCFWQLEGVLRTAAGYAGGSSKDPDYNQVCRGSTGHAEVVEVVYEPEIITTNDLLKVFWENHDPTQGMRQGNDRGSQYRSLLVCYSREQLRIAQETQAIYQQQLDKNDYGQITTEIMSDQIFYLAEDYHQQYLQKNPGGYCGLAGTGICSEGS